MWSAACTIQHAEGCLGLGDKLSRKKSELPKAFDALVERLQLGHPHACTELGMLVTRKHDPTWPDERPSTDYLTQGCENGDPEGCFPPRRTRAAAQG